MASDSVPSPQPDELHPAGCLLRALWMGFGNILLLSLAASVFQSESYTWLDAAYAGSVLGLIAARYVDIRRFEGLTVHSEPATMDHFRRYVVALVGFSAALWVVARAAGPGFG